MDNSKTTMNDSLKENILDSLNFLAEINHYMELHGLGEISDNALIETIKRRKNEYGYIANPRQTAKILRQFTEWENEEPSVISELFKSEAEEYIFYLLELDGSSRMQKLNITPFHYQNKEYAKKWRDEIYQKISPFVSSHPLSEKALEELNRLYKSRQKSNECCYDKDFYFK